MGGPRPPRTSYGYLAPACARVKGWACCGDDCSVGGEPSPPFWPHLCPKCRRSVDPTFEEPWAHEALGYRYRFDLARSDTHDRQAAELTLRVWEYEDAWMRGDEESARRAWTDFQQTICGASGGSATWATLRIVAVASEVDDIDPAVEMLLEWYPKIDARDIDDDNRRRTDALWFVAACTYILEREASITNPRVQVVDAAMRDVAARAEPVLTASHQDGFRRHRELRDRHVAREAIGASRQSPEAIRHTLPSLAMARTALVALNTHDDQGPLNVLIERLEQLGSDTESLAFAPISTPCCYGGFINRDG